MGIARVEQAAASRYRREHPWGGDAFDPARANTHESGLGQTMPVHLYPAGAALVHVYPNCKPEKVYDLAGNVWEWTADLDKDGWPWLKGGSWYQDGRNVGASAANRNNPRNRNDNIGLRVVVVHNSRRPRQTGPVPKTGPVSGDVASLPEMSSAVPAAPLLRGGKRETARSGPGRTFHLPPFSGKG